MKPHIEDQLKAAIAEGQRIFNDIASETPGEVSHPHDVDWAKERLMKSHTCPHLGAAPQPAFLLLGISFVCCKRCLPASVDFLMTQRDQTCDECGQFCPDNIFREFTIQRGPLTIMGHQGTCCEPNSNS